MRSIFCAFMFAVALCQAADPLRIVSVSPQGSVAFSNDVQTITVTFNQPMTALQTAPTELAQGPLTVQPAVKGKYRWMGTRTLAFTPDVPFRMASRYVVTVPAGVKSVSGQSLAEAYTWTIETPVPRLLGSKPNHEAKRLRLDQSFYLRFNQTMALDRIAGHIYLLDGTVNLPVDFSFPTQKELDWQLGDDSTRVIKVTPRSALKKGRTYTLTVAENLLAAEGDLGVAESSRLSFTTFGPLRFIRYSSSDSKEPTVMKPNSGIQFFFSNPVAYSELVKHLSFTPQVKIPDYYQDRTRPSANPSLTLEFRPETAYSFTISSELCDEFGNRLDKPITGTFTTTAYPPRVSLNTGAGVLEAKGDRRFPCYFVNVNSVGLRMGLVPPDRVVPLLLNPDSLYAPAAPLPANLFMVDRTWSMENPLNVKIVRPLEVDWLLAGRKSGLVLAEIDDRISEGAERYKRIFLQVTDLGVSAKFSAVNNVFWVTRLSDASPVAGARVEVRDDTNQKLWSGMTNEQGLVESPGWRELKVKQTDRWSTPRQWVIVYKDLDVAYASSDWGTGIEPYRFDISYEWNPEPIKKEGILFTDRNLYRAGETVHIKGLLREKKFSDWQPPSVKQVRLKIHDSRGTLIHTDTLAVSSFGSLNMDLALDELAPLGYYDVVAESLSATEENYGYIMNGFFRVEAFRPAEFSVTMVPEQESVILGDSVRTHIKGAYLFGAAMAHQEISWRVFMNRTSYTPPDRESWSFGPCDWMEDSEEYAGLPLSQGKGVLDRDGQYHLTARAKAENIDRPQQLVVSADVKSPGNQVIGANALITVHPADFYIGLKPSTTFAQVNKPFAFQMITVSPDGKTLPDRSVKIRIVQRQWHSVRKAGIDGRYEWISRYVDTAVDSVRLSGQSEPVSSSFTLKQAGYYLLRAEGRDPAGRKTVSEVSFYVTGSGYVAWEREDDDRIELVPDKSRYQPGEVARVMVKSPFEKARALVTLEREGILWQQAVSLQGSTPTIEIPITESYLPNAFISVILLHGRSSSFVFSQEGEDIGRPAFKIGYANLTVDAGSKHLQMTVKADQEEYRPGEPVTVTVEVRDHKGRPAAAEVTLAVVDRGILNLTHYELPDPYLSFYNLRPLSVQTSETRLHVVEQRNYGQKGEARGGGGAEFGERQTDLRRNWKSAAYWNPALMTDANGRAQVTFTLPDNLTSFKIMAVGQTLDAKFGRASNDFNVRLPLLLQAALPRFCRKGDQFEAGVVVHNYSGHKGKGTIKVEVNGITLKGAKQAEFELENGDSRAVLFPFAADQMGRAVLRFRCTMDDLSDGLEKTLTVQAPTVVEQTAVYKRVEQSVKEKLQPPADVHAELTKLEMTAASSAMAEFSGAVEYLLAYPYECLEQRLSKALPFIVSADLVKAFAIPTTGEQDYDAVVNSILKDMVKFQNEDGGFSYWQGNGRSWPFVSVYAAYGLTLAKKAGFRIDDAMLDWALDYLRQVLNGDVSRDSFPYDDLCWKTTDCFILYVLALNDRTDAGYVEKLTTRSDDLPLTAQTYLLRTVQLLLDQPKGNVGLQTGVVKSARKAGVSVNPLEARRTELVQKMINRLRVSPTTAYFEEPEGDLVWIFHSNVRATAQCLQALLEAGADVPMAENVVRWLLTNRKDGHWSNTQENFYVLQALSTYFERYEKVEPRFEAQIKLAGRQALSFLFAGRSTHIERRSESLAAFGSKPFDVEIKKDGDGALYYGLRLSYFPTQFKEPLDQGMAVLKSVTPVESAFLKDGSYPLGQVFRVTLTLETPLDRYFVVMNDPLPAGLEPIQVDLAGVSAAVQQYDDQQTDWWSGFTHVEKHDDRVLLFADYLPAGVTSYSYLLRSVTKGRYTVPPTKAEEMYTPEVFGRTISKVIDVK